MGGRWAGGLQGDGLGSGGGEELPGTIREFLILNEEVHSRCEMLCLFQRQLPPLVFILEGEGPSQLRSLIRKSVAKEPARAEITCLQVILITEAKTNYVVH